MNIINVHCIIRLMNKKTTDSKSTSDYYDQNNDDESSTLTASNDTQSNKTKSTADRTPEKNSEKTSKRNEEELTEVDDETETKTSRHTRTFFKTKYRKVYKIVNKKRKKNKKGNGKNKDVTREITDPHILKYVRSDDTTNEHRKIDRYGWYIDNDETETTDEKEVEKESERERRYELKWLEIVKKWDKYSTKKPKKIEKRIKKGIPDGCRNMVWCKILLYDLDLNNLKDISYYYDMGTPKGESTILVDIPRTMPKVSMFKDGAIKSSLYRILRAYSNSDPELGYFQGIAFIAGIFLLYMDEKSAFQCFTSIMNGKRHKLRDFYINGFQGLREANTIWDYIIKLKFKKIHKKIHDVCLEPMLYTPSWFLCAFMNVPFPPKLKLYIFDQFCYFGTRTLFTVGLTIISLNQEKILNCDGFDTILTTFQEPPHVNDPNYPNIFMKEYRKNFIKNSEYKEAFTQSNIEYFF